MWSGIWSVAITGIGFWTWIWPTRHCRLGQEVACWYQCWKISTIFIWLVKKHWCYWCENRWVCSWGKIIFQDVGLIFSSKLDWCSYIISFAKAASKKIGALIDSMKFLSLEVALYLYKSTMPPCMECYCHIS